MPEELQAANIYMVFAENAGHWILGLLSVPAGTQHDVVMAYAEKKWLEDDAVPKTAVIRAAVPFEMVEDAVRGFGEQLKQLGASYLEPM
jgi:hypothetical protein